MPFPPIPLVPVVEKDRAITPDWARWCRSLSDGGVWTPTDASGAALSFTNTTGNCGYDKIGRQVTAWFRVTYPATADGTATSIGGLPFAAQSTTASVFGGAITSTDETTAARLLVSTSAPKTFTILTTGGTQITNATMSGNDLRGVITYMAAQ